MDRFCRTGLRPIALCVLLICACEPEVPRPSLVPTPSAATPSATTVAETPAATPSTTPPSASQSAVAGVRTNPMGLLSGNWIFVAKQLVHQAQTESQIWAVPIAGGTPKLAVAYDVPSGGTPGALIDNAPYIRREFSPDGRRMVIAVNGELVVVELESGRARALGVKGSFPSWSRDGAQVAFLIAAPNPGAIGPDVTVAVVAADGGGLVRTLGSFIGAYQSLEWSVDGANLLVPKAPRRVGRGRRERGGHPHDQCPTRPGSVVRPLSEWHASSRSRALRLCGIPKPREPGWDLRPDPDACREPGHRRAMPARSRPSMEPRRERTSLCGGAHECALLPRPRSRHRLREGRDPPGRRLSGDMERRWLADRLSGAVPSRGLRLRGSSVVA